MPTVLIIAAPTDQHPRIGGRINSAIAAALGLAVQDVYTTFLAPGAAFLGLSEVEPWPIALIHGRPRPQASMAAAAAEVTRILAEEWDTIADRVHVQWVTAT